ncbi:MAG: CinA family protein [Atopobiaceae bacterium]|nr:CinA family protein [Atopobiaceae bacterium]
MRDAEALVHEARAAGRTLGTAESCTGGLVSATITDIPGSSEVMMGGITSYACSVKESVLGVPPLVIDGVGPVSSECACAMAEGARAVLACDVSVSVTGIAGPGGAEEGKPVGTVWIGRSTAASTSARLHTFTGDRDEVRAQAVRVALAELHEGLMECGGTLA